MGMFADSVGELPGRAEDVRAVAQNLATLKTDLDNASTTYESAPGLAPSWEGASADAFDTVHSAASKDLRVAGARQRDRRGPGLTGSLRQCSGGTDQGRGKHPDRRGDTGYSVGWYERSGAGVPGGVGR